MKTTVKSSNNYGKTASMCDLLDKSSKDDYTSEELGLGDSRRSQSETGDAKDRGALDDDLRNRIIKEEEKAVKKARVLVVVALCACIIAVSSAIYVFASNGDQHSFELEVSITISLAPYSHGIDSNLILSHCSTKALQEILLLWFSGKSSTTLLWYSSSVLP
jgi:hypothetical protein